MVEVEAPAVVVEVEPPAATRQGRRVHRLACEYGMDGREGHHIRGLAAATHLPDAGKRCASLMMIVEELGVEVVPVYRDNCPPRSL